MKHDHPQNVLGKREKLPRTSVVTSNLPIRPGLEPQMMCEFETKCRLTWYSWPSLFLCQPKSCRAFKALNFRPQISEADSLRIKKYYIILSLPQRPISICMSNQGRNSSKLSLTSLQYWWNIGPQQLTIDWRRQIFIQQPYACNSFGYNFSSKPNKRYNYKSHSDPKVCVPCTVIIQYTRSSAGRVPRWAGACCAAGWEMLIQASRNSKWIVSPICTKSQIYLRGFLDWTIQVLFRASQGVIWELIRVVPICCHNLPVPDLTSPDWSFKFPDMSAWYHWRMVCNHGTCPDRLQDPNRRLGYRTCVKQRISEIQITTSLQCFANETAVAGFVFRPSAGNK